MSEVIKLRQKGLTLKSIGEYFNCSRAVISQKLKELNYV